MQHAIALGLGPWRIVEKNGKMLRFTAFLVVKSEIGKGSLCFVSYYQLKYKYRNLYNGVKEIR